ncbi:MAG: SBBP repeat-containing protein, partial [Ignavibacteria bacterium]
IWTRRYNGSRNGEDIAYSIAIDASGNVYVTGSSEGTIGTHGIFEDYVTIKYNSSGVQQWVNSYNGPGGDFDAAYSIAVDGSGNVYVTGESGGGSGGSGMPYQDYATVKYNSAGVFQWVQRYNGTVSGADDKANQLKLDVSGNIYVTGKSEGVSSSHDYLTIKYNPAGTLLWSARYNGTGNSEDESASLDVDRAGNVYVTGNSYTGSSYGNDMVTIKYNSTGVQQWVNSYNGPANSDDGGRSIQVDTSSNVYVTGYSAGSLTAHDFATVKYNSAGVIQWSERYTNGDLSGSGDDPACIKVDNAGNVYVSGMSALDYATVKYSVTTGIEKKSSDHPVSFSLEQNYPNPFNPSTKIGFNLLSGGFVSLKVFDITGKLVSVPVSEYMNAGVHEITFNASQLSTGTYFYKLESADFSDVKKMILIK